MSQVNSEPKPNEQSAPATVEPERGDERKEEETKTVPKGRVTKREQKIQASLAVLKEKARIMQERREKLAEKPRNPKKINKPITKQPRLLKPQLAEGAENPFVKDKFPLSHSLFEEMRSHTMSL